MLKNFRIKLLVHVVFYLVVSCLTVYFLETPLLFETALAEEITADTSEKKEDPIIAENQQKTPKSYSDILWGYRWYFLGLTGIIIIGLVVYFSNSASTVAAPEGFIPQGLMPHIPGQTITDLRLVRPDVHIDPGISALMPEVISVDANFKHQGGVLVADPNFMKGFRVGDNLYQVYLMPQDTPFPEVSQNFWINEAQRMFGRVNFAHPTETFLYTQVAVIPVDTITYTVYNKVDIVQVIADPGNTSVPVIKASFLFRDNEFGWVK